MTNPRTIRTRRAVETVLDLAARGMHVFPLRPGDKRPAVDRWEQRATTDPDRIARCWSHAPYGVGIACGPSRLVVVDLDTAKGDQPPAPGVESGEDVLALLYERHGDRYPFGTTPTARTASGGTHLYYRAPDGAEVRNSASRIGWKVDVRAVGGYVVAPPSTAAGNPYTWLTAPADADPLPLPAWLAERAAPRPVVLPQPTMPTVVRNATGYTAAALRGELETVLAAQPGTRNDTLHRAAFNLGTLAGARRLDSRLAVEALLAAGQSIGLTPREVQATVTSGMRAGTSNPRSSA
ncbi:bifunctional DNA primase/polymerase [Streptomyces sp. DSM 42041]|uniref:Bifunctional DNA primase/polymerase n=1 Tax=Streptomyces hazeniae TaxID=3075538 RepID=A0ABU2NZJ5_9ACTN|nr:bifunctional DNA primase/polymerase [Streptomyces sp. DSM 42041]MDT0382407.1 bifunctional DNA primase/polymerase [Streptomyces sp. DSM 42041]